MESKRIEELRNYRILDTLSEKEFDAITQIASHICNAPISLITLIDKDRQWFKSARGVGDLRETPRSIAFCAHTIQEENKHLVVNDLTKDERFVGNPFVVGAPHVKFYAGVSLVTPNGHKIGTVCVFDDKPREVTPEQLSSLDAMANSVIYLLETRKKNRELEAAQQLLKEMNEQLEEFSYAVAHDIKSPLRTIASFSSLLKRRAKEKLTISEIEYLDFISSGAKDLSSYTQQLLQFAKETNLDVNNSSEVDLNELFGSINSLLNKDKKVNFIHDDNLPTIFTSNIGLQQVLQNLMNNSIQYRNPNVPNSYVGIEFSETPKYYHFKIMDNGIGISKERTNELFKLFKKDNKNETSNGIGLNVVKRLVQKMNGQLSIESTENVGTTVEFSIERIMKH